MNLSRPALALAFLVALSVPSRLEAAAGEDLSVIPHSSRGALSYVPVYSSVFYKDSKRTIELSATLSIHNTDPANPVTVSRVDYHNTDGKLIRHYLDAPLVLAPLATKNFVVDQADQTGGTGANFMVAWESGTPVATPIIEALMISVASGQGISFIAPAKVVRSRE